MKLLKDMRLWVMASYAVFCIGLLSGWTWWDKQTDQYRDYMLGRAAFTATMYDLSAQYFDKSYSYYLAQTSGASAQDLTVLAAPPSLEMAELSQHFKALALINMGNAKLAVIAFKEALKLTTDYALYQQKLDQATVEKLRADRKTTQIDFEILFHQQEQLAKKEGKGKNEGPADEKQSDDPSKGNQAGKNAREEL